MGERLSFPGFGKSPEFDRKALEISDMPQGSENLLFGLTRVKNLTVERMDLPKASLQDFRESLEYISTYINRKPNTLVLCNAGVLRSKLLADYLFKEKLVTLEDQNMNSRKLKAKGLGVSAGLSELEIDFSKNGLAIVNDGKEKRIDLLILALAGSDKDPLDAQTLGRMAAFLDNGLKSVNELNNSFNIFWLNGVEEEFETWFHHSVKKLK